MSSNEIKESNPELKLLLDQINNNLTSLSLLSSIIQKSKNPTDIEKLNKKLETLSLQLITTQRKLIKLIV